MQIIANVDCFIYKCDVASLSIYNSYNIMWGLTGT